MHEKRSAALDSDDSRRLRNIEADDRIEVIDYSDVTESPMGTRKWMRIGDLVAVLRDALIV